VSLKENPNKMYGGLKNLKKLVGVSQKSSPLFNGIAISRNKVNAIKVPAAFLHLL